MTYSAFFCKVAVTHTFTPQHVKEPGRISFPSLLPTSPGALTRRSACALLQEKQAGVFLSALVLEAGPTS